MTVRTEIRVRERDTLRTVREVLKSLFEEKLIDAMLVPLEVPRVDRVTPTIIRDPMQLNAANPLAPVMRMNSAGMLAHQRREDNGTRLGVVMHPCELRTLIELSKVGRIDLKSLLLIGIDCMGTYEPDTYAQIARGSTRSPTDETLRWTRQGPIAPYRLRNACQICEHFTPEHVDIAISLIGYDVRERMMIEASDDMAEQLNWRPSDHDGREKALTRLAGIRRHRREAAIAQAEQMVNDVSSLFAIFAQCDACGKCNDACPFCGTAAFRPSLAKGGRAFDTPALMSGGVGPFDDLVAWGRRAASCVSCGMCESACEKQTPLVAIQAALGRKLQETYHYVPGRDIHERLPWAMAG